MRKFLTLDGDVLEQTDWVVSPIDVCFYCDMPLGISSMSFCPKSQDNNHEWITLVNPQTRR